MLQAFPLKEDPCATVSLSLTPAEILKGTLHSIKREAQQGSSGFCHPSKSSMCRKAFTQKGPTWDLPQRELLALSLCPAGAGLCSGELAEVVGGGSCRE